MVVDDRARLRLHGRLRDVLGDEDANTLMDELGSLARDQSATRNDLLAVESRMRNDMSDLRGEFADLRGEFADLRVEFADLRADFGILRGEFGELRGEFGDLRAEVAERLEQHTRSMLVTVVGSMATIAGIAFGAARLG